MHFHHIGVATNDIEKSKKAYAFLGYQLLFDIFDPNQKVNLCFLVKRDAPMIELVAPVDETSPVSSILKKNGTMPYHTCYEVENLDAILKSFKVNKYILVVKPIEAIAFDKRKIAFVYHPHAGLIEFLEVKNTFSIPL